MRPGVEKRHEPRDVEFNFLIEVHNSFHELLLGGTVINKPRNAKRLNNFSN
jgi:hypothetical protein